MSAKSVEIKNESGRSFVASKVNIPFNHLQTDIWYSKLRSTKEIYINKFFEGFDNLKEKFNNKFGWANPMEAGDDYNFVIRFKDPTTLFGINYKKIKYFASNVFWDTVLDTENENNDIEKVSFWFVRGTTTKWVDGVPIVSFTLQCDVWATFSHIFKNLKGQLHFKRKHQPRFVRQQLINNNGVNTNSEVFVPDIKNNRGHLNCSTFCKSKNAKVISNLDVKESYPKNFNLTEVCIIYYTSADAKEYNSGDIHSETIIKFSDNKKISQPYGIIYVIDPYKIEEVSLNIDKPNGEGMYSQRFQKTRYELAITILQAPENNCKIQNIEFTSLNNFTRGLYYFRTYEWMRCASWVSDVNFGGKVAMFNYGSEFQYDVYYKNLNFMINNIETILSDKITYKNEPHIYMSNHTEIRLAIPEKNAGVTDFSLLFQNGNPIRFDEVDNQPYIRGVWKQVLDPENGGKLLYLENSSSDFESSLYNSRGIIDFTGSNNFPYKTSTYLESMQTRRNQKQASYDNINTQRQTAEYVRGQNIARNTTNTVADALGDAANIVQWDPLASGRAYAHLQTNLAKNIAKTVTDANIEQAQYKAQEKMARASTDASYADLANSASNVSVTGKISSYSTLTKQILANPDSDSVNLYKVRWFKNQVNEYDLQQIAFELNRYGYTLDLLIDIKSFDDLITRVYWDYVEIVNIKDFIKQLPYDWNLIQYLSGIFESGITIHNADEYDEEEPFYIDFNRNNYEYEILELFYLDVELDNFMI